MTRPLSPTPAAHPKKGTRRETLHLTCLMGVLLGLATVLGFYSTFVFGDRKSASGPAVLGFVVLVLVASVVMGLFIRLLIRRNALTSPAGTTMAMQREAARVVRRRRPTGDPRVDEVARLTAEGVLRYSPWSTVRIPLIIFVLVFGLNVASAAMYFAAPSASSGLPWGNLVGAAFFLFMAVVHPTVAAAQRENAHVFLNALDRAERERSVPEAGL
ncbi:MULTISPECIES: hypothetical protein [unclassified Nocardiopsis]|uniref:hypothetical protein n=1 Tax=Nocardiopsis TaxID=2013 RepID=UPI00387AB81A